MSVDSSSVEPSHEGSRSSGLGSGLGSGPGTWSDVGAKVLGQTPAGRVARVALGAAVAVGGTASLVARRRVSKVKESTSPNDALFDPPTDLTHCSFPTHDGGTIHYVDSDPGTPDLPTVVLLHGITNQWWMWSAVMRLLREGEQHVRVLSWDMRGFGSSVAGSDGVDIGAAAHDLATLLQHADVRNAVVVGHSMGGMELARFLADGDKHIDARARVGGALFLGTTARSIDGTLRTGGLVRTSAQSAALARAGLGPSLVRWEDNDLSILLLRNGFGRLVTPRMIADQRRCQAEARHQSLVEGMTSISKHDVLDALASDVTLRSLPVHIMVGSEDHLTPTLHSRALAKAIPHAELVELEGIGHNVMQEDPHAVVRSIMQLLQPMHLQALGVHSLSHDPLTKGDLVPARLPSGAVPNPLPSGDADDDSLARSS